MNPSIHLTKVSGCRFWQAAARRLLLAGFPAGFSGTAFAQTTDLAYTSPSTGVDGPLVIADTLPTFHGGSYPALLAYDNPNDRLIAIGREFENSQHMGTYAFKDGAWMHITQTRYLIETTMIYDGTTNRIMRFGGTLSNNSNFYQGQYTLTESGWESLFPDGGRPPLRTRCSLAYDAARNEVLLFGEENSDGYLEDTWTWNGSNWTQESPSSKPPSRESSAMAYDPNRQVIVLCLAGSGGNLETWEWDGTNWTKKATTSSPGERQYHGLVYNPQTSSVQLHNGNFGSNPTTNADSWSWDGSSWTLLTISPYFFDMSSKPDGIWNFTFIDIGTTEVKFIKNAANTPVIWLATEDVIIDGHLNLDGTKAYQGYTSSTEPYNLPAPGGPGGYNGGLGGYYETATGADVAGIPGVGPGGGAASPAGGQTGDLDAYHALHFNTYNSSSLQDISGGSGGGGAASATYAAGNEFGRGGNGGGGGGAIVIASSKDIWINGSITAIGGEGRFGTYKTISSSILRTGSSQGGSGSGGAIRLVADRVFVANGSSLDASSDIDNGHDRDDQPENKGRIRIEAYFHNVSWTNNFGNEHYSLTAPKNTLLPPNNPTLTLVSIAGQGVSVNPSSDPASPEVTFSSAGAVTIALSSQNVPDGSTVNLRVTSNNEVIIADPQILAGGSANFSVTVPAGKGFVQAWTNWEVSP